MWNKMKVINNERMVSMVVWINVSTFLSPPRCTRFDLAKKTQK